VLAALGTLTVETPLHDSPDPAAPVIALLPEGTTVSVDGPPVEGFYPVTTGELSGWMRGETMQLEKDTQESVAAEELEADPLADAPDETVPGEVSVALEPAPDSVASTTVDAATDPATDAPGAPEDAAPLGDPLPEEVAESGVEPVPAEELPLANETVPMDEPAMDDVAHDPPTSDLASEGETLSVLTAPDGAASAPDSGDFAAEVAAAPTMDPDRTSILVAEGALVGSATVTADAPILLGPGPDYGVITAAPAGSTVEKTGHVIDGYVTVQFAEVTGWVDLQHLGVPGALAVESSPTGAPTGETTGSVELPAAETPPAQTAPTETASTQTPTTDPAPAEVTPTVSVPVEMEPVEAAPVDAPPGDMPSVDAT
jgi:uncharacterized protein YraI